MVVFWIKFTVIFYLSLIIFDLSASDMPKPRELNERLKTNIQFHVTTRIYKSDTIIELNAESKKTKINTNLPQKDTSQFKQTQKNISPNIKCRKNIIEISQKVNIQEESGKEIYILPPPPIKEIWVKIKEWFGRFWRNVKKTRIPSWGNIRWWMKRKWREFKRWSQNRRSKFTVWGIYIAFLGLCLLFCSLVATLLTPSAVVFFLILGLVSFIGGIGIFIFNLFAFEFKGKNKRKRIPLHKY